MVFSTRKRVLIVIVIFGVLFLIFRNFLFDGFLETTQLDYHRKAGTPVLISVYYEALCPDSKHFIIKQLIPTYKQLAPIVSIELVAYGKATTINNPDGTYNFDCQHGPTECQANIYHACVNEAVGDINTRLDVVACMIRDNRLPKEAMHKCTKQHNVDNVDTIQKCYDSSHGAELFKLNGDATHALRPGVSFIPTITLDGSQNRQAAILKNLMGEVCRIAGDTKQSKELCNKT